MSRPSPRREPQAGGARLGAALAVVISSLGALGCQTDLNARTSPLVDGGSQAGQAMVFGHYRGLARVGAAGADYSLDLYAAKCGAEMFGLITAPDGSTADLVGGRDGSTLWFEFDGDAGAGLVTGRIETARVLSGAWSTLDGLGGRWVAAYIDGSVADFPCDAAPDYLAAIDR